MPNALPCRIECTALKFTLGRRNPLYQLSTSSTCATKTNRQNLGQMQMPRDAQKGEIILKVSLLIRRRQTTSERSEWKRQLWERERFMSRRVFDANPSTMSSKCKDTAVAVDFAVATISSPSCLVSKVHALVNRTMEHRMFYDALSCEGRIASVAEVSRPLVPLK